MRGEDDLRPYLREATRLLVVRDDLVDVCVGEAHGLRFFKVVGAYLLAIILHGIFFTEALAIATKIVTAVTFT